MATDSVIFMRINVEQTSLIHYCIASHLWNIAIFVLKPAED